MTTQSWTRDVAQLAQGFGATVGPASKRAPAYHGRRVGDGLPQDTPRPREDAEEPEGADEEEGEGVVRDKLRGTDCPNFKNHTKQPEGYLQWHEWAENKAKTHTQEQCPVCGLWCIWKRKPKEPVWPTPSSSPQKWRGRKRHEQGNNYEETIGHFDRRIDRG